MYVVMIEKVLKAFIHVLRTFNYSRLLFMGRKPSSFTCSLVAMSHELFFIFYTFYFFFFLHVRASLICLKVAGYN